MIAPIVMDVLPNFWNKTHFTISIDKTPGTQNNNHTQEITSEMYRDFVIQGTNRWNDVLHQNHHGLFPNISEITFEVVGEPDGTEDISIQWWESNQNNGLAECFPENSLVKTSSVIHISKNKQRGAWHQPEQIASITTHELGHVLGLGHIVPNTWGQNPFTNDLMITGTQIQPDPRRRISNLNLQMIDMMFGATTDDKRNILPNQISMPISEWVALG